MKISKKHLWILIIIVSISGFSQGMLLPLIAVILEGKNIASSINGIHATGLYLGILLASPFMEAPLRKYGFKPLIVFGGLAVIISLFSFTLWDSLIFWFILRLIIGIGDHALHFSTQTWITTYSPAHKRGKNISLYGLSFGLGFAIGPFILPLLTINPKLPFIISAFISLLGWLTIFLIKNEFPEKTAVETYTFRSTFERFKQIFTIAWAPLLPAFCYGVLEATLNGNFPVYGIRIGLDVQSISLLLPAFSIGGILFQLPLGIISDKFGRKRILLAIFLIGTILFFIAGLFEQSFIILIICFFLLGMVLGSTFSLSIAYLTDCLPKSLLPAGNLLTGICFSIGSISGPFIAGLIIQYFQGFSFFYFLGFLLFIIFLAMASYQKPTSPVQENQ